MTDNEDGSDETGMPATCATCGSLLSSHDRHLRFRLPDPALDVPDEEWEGRFWGNDVMMMLQGLGAFVRGLLPVHLTDGGSLTFGLWVGVHPDELQHLWEVWWEPEYADVSFSGHLANDLAPWSGQVLARPVTAQVRDPDAVPYVTDSEDALMRRVVTECWDSDQILAPYAHLL